MKMSYREFVRMMIHELRKPSYTGIHVVYSGFNERFREYYDEDPRPVIDQLVDEGFLKIFQKTGGPIIFLASEYVPKGQRKQGEKKPASTVAKAKKAKAKGKEQNPKLRELTEQIRRNSQGNTQRSTAIHGKLCAMLAAGEITAEEAIEAHKNMEKLAWTALDRITQWLDALEKNADS